MTDLETMTARRDWWRDQARKLLDELTEANADAGAATRQIAAIGGAIAERDAYRAAAVKVAGDLAAADLP